MARQLTLDLPVRQASGREDFFVSAANALAVSTVEGWRDWPGRKLLLVGAAGSGKSHLAEVWAGLAAARVLSACELDAAAIPALVAEARNIAVEDADRIAGNEPAEQALFHLHNLVLAEGGALLLTAATPPRRWSLALADLASRMQGTNMVRLDPPDDDLLRAVLLKLFADRQLDVTPRLVDYLVTRMPRSLADAAQVVAALDDAALSQGGPVTRALAASVLDKCASGTA